MKTEKEGSAPTLKPCRPALRYHGGKWRLAPWILSHFPAHRCYVEPFGGGASVLLRKERSYAEVYNDLDGDVVNLFRVLRDPEMSARLAAAVALTPFARAEFDVAYLPSDDAVERARRLLTLSHMGFGTAAMRENRNGRRQRTGFRANTSRSGTTPAADWSRLPDVIETVAERFAAVVIENRTAIQVMEAHDGPETLHYIDPPYPHGTRAKGCLRSYRHEMTDDDHRELARCLRGLAGHVVLSGYPCDLYDVELYPDWQRIEKTTHADGARERTEVIWIKPAQRLTLTRTPEATS